MSSKKIPIYCVIALAPILRDANIQSPSISKAQLLYHAKLWRRKQGKRIGSIVVTEDPLLSKLIAKIDAIPVVDPPITKHELSALFSFYLKHHDKLMPGVWEEFCGVLKYYNNIPFNLGVCCLSGCVDSLVPLEKPKVPFAALDRLFDDLIPSRTLNRFLTIATNQEYDTFWPNVFDFFSAISRLFEQWPNAVIGKLGVIFDNHLVEYPVGWDSRLTVVLDKIKNKSKK